MNHGIAPFVNAQLYDYSIPHRCVNSKNPVDPHFSDMNWRLTPTMPFSLDLSLYLTYKIEE